MANRAKSQPDANVDAGVVRLNVNLNADTAAALKKLSEDLNLSLTETVRRAISVYNYIDEETRSGRRIQTTDADRSNVREFVLI